MPAASTTLLLIDDDRISREIIATLFAADGIVVRSAQDGPSALRMLDDGLCTPSLILMDAQMPGLSGEELLAALRQRTTARIVLISASNPSTELCAAADEFLLKPLGGDEIQRLLDDHRKLLDAMPQPPVKNTTTSDSDLDSATLTRLRGMMPEAAVREIYSALLTDLDLRLDALRAALVASDGEEIRRIGHAIKGGATLCGATRLTLLGARIENGELPAPPSYTTASEREQIGTKLPLFVNLSTAIARLRRILLQMSLAGNCNL